MALGGPWGTLGGPTAIFLWFFEKNVFPEKSIKDISFDKEIMLAGNIQINDNLEKFKKLAGIIDISGGLETSGLKDISKIEFFLNKMKNLNNET